MLDLASSQAGELRLIREPMQLSDLLARVITLAEPMAREKGLTWETEFPPHLPLVLGDRTRLQQVILNLVSNAVKFTEQGSVSLWVEIGKKEAVIAVSDTGLGIHPLSRTRFSTSSSSRSERRAAATAGWGSAWRSAAGWWSCMAARSVCSRPAVTGAGSTFYFTLPILMTAAGDTRGGRPGADCGGAHRTRRRRHPPGQLSAGARVHRGNGSDCRGSGLARRTSRRSSGRGGAGARTGDRARLGAHSTAEARPGHEQRAGAFR